MTKTKNKTFLFDVYRLFGLTICFFLSFGFAYANPTGGGAGGVCTENAFYDSLANSESGGCGGGNQYNCMGPVITSGTHRGDRPLGKYQFMPKTLRGMGIDPNNFVGNASAQERAIREFTAQNDAYLERNGAYNYIGQTRNGVTITKSGLLAAAHLGGAGGALKWARGGGGPSDQLGTSLADYAAKFEGYDIGGSGTDGTCGEGIPNAADVFAQAQAEGRAGIIDQAGCDPAIGNQMKQQAEAIRKQMTENANALITKPPSLMQLTCFDQYTKINSEGIGRIHSDPPQGISDTIAPNVEMPSMQNIMSNFTSGLGFGGILSSLTSSFQSYLGSLTGGLLGGGGAGGGCDMMNQMWEMMQCFDLPQMPSLQDIMGGAGGGGIGQITNALGSLANGDIGGLMGAACEAIGGGGGGSNAFQDLADSLSEDDEEENTCDYTLQVRIYGDRIAYDEFMKIDDVGNNNDLVEAEDFEAVDTNRSCTISDDELEVIGVDVNARDA